MTPEQWERVDRVWHAVLARPEADRSDALDELCDGDDTLRRDVDSLLQHLARASHDGFGASTGPRDRAPLQTGARLGPYQIDSAIGAGGMGDVYRARDFRLARDVAIKVLPFGVARDHYRLLRFEQEARAAAALNHPNVLAVHDVGSARLSLDSFELDSRTASPPTDNVEVSFIVTELLKGRTLRQLLVDEQLSLARAVDIASQIADGLAAAHARGIVHRDLKPENLFLTSDGHAKILDFGLAEATAGVPAGDGGVTGSGAGSPPIVGTPGYMAPEQIQGQPADHRADVFAFGAVFFEMLTGRRAFDGGSVFERMTAVLRDTPAATLSTPDRPIPFPVVRIVERCLEKQPAARFQSTTDLAFALKGLTLDTSGSGLLPVRASTTTPRSPWRTLLPWVMNALLAITLVAVWPSGQAENGKPFRFTIGEPPGVSFGTNPPLLPYPALSPDGQRLVFVATLEDGRRQLYLRDMAQTESRPIPGTESSGRGGMQPFWSSDSRSIGFGSDGSLKRLDLESGNVKTLTSIPGFAGGTWSDNTIVFSAGNKGLWRIDANGGEPQKIYEVDKERGGKTLTRPSFLPDGRHFTFLPYPGQEFLLGSLDGSAPKVLAKGDSAAYYDPNGFLVYVRSTDQEVGTLFAQRFDMKTLTLTGDLIALADNVYVGLSGAAFTMSSTGVLVYRTSTAAEVMRRLTWLGRDGAPLDSPGEASRFNGFDLFPDGRRVLVSARDGLQEPDLHTLDVASGRRTRVTFSPEVDTNPLLSPDGRMLLWARWSASREPALYRKATDGSGTEERLGALPHNFTHLTHTTGRWTVATVTGQSGPDIWYLDGGDPRTAKPYQQTDAVEDRGRLSSDGRFMAFNFTDEGPLRVHVRPFPNAEGGLWPVPGSKAGRFPHWRGDGGELYYKTATELMAVDVMVDKGGVVSFGTPHVLFRTPPGVGFQHNFAVTPDGQKFLMAIPDTKAPADTEGAVTPLTVVVNWRSLLSKR